MAAPVQVNEIDSLWWSPVIGDFRSVGLIVTDLLDIEQCIRIILGTPIGSDPFRPTFGASFLPYIDMPINEASPFIVREAVRAILTWEPRIQARRIDVTPQPAEYSSSVLSVIWQLRENPAIARTTEVAI